MSDFLQVAGQTFVVFGVANRKSVAWAVAKTLEEQGARVVYSVRSEARRKSLETLLAGKPVFLCDVEQPGAAERLAAEVAAAGHTPVQGLVHSIAFANYSEGFKPFHETKRADFLQATAVSAFSLVEVARAFKPHLAPNASVVMRPACARLVRRAKSAPLQRPELTTVGSACRMPLCPQWLPCEPGKSSANQPAGTGASRRPGVAPACLA